MFNQFNTIVFFTIIMLGFGYSVFFLTKAARQRNLLLHIIEMAAVGLAVFVLAAIILNILRIPLHFIAFTILALICPLIAAIQSMRKRETIRFVWDTQETICAILLILLLGAYLAFFLRGANAYPYLEDDDPWGHATGSMYISTAHTYSVDQQVRQINGGYANYLEPYPPTYDVFMGVMRQMNDSITWTLKFFNVLLMTLGLAFAYLLFKTYLKSDLKALFAAFVLAALPSFMSHFIWAQTIAIMLFLAGMYAFARALEDDSWRIPAIIIIGAQLVTQPAVSLMFGALVILLTIIVFLGELRDAAWHVPARWSKIRSRFRMTSNAIMVGACGLALSFLYWGEQLIKWGYSGIFAAKGGELSGWAQGYLYQPYTWHQVVFPGGGSRIDQAHGWGLGVTIALVLGIILVLFTAKRTLGRGWAHKHILAWFALFAYIVFAPTFGLPSWGAARMWVFLAIPVALLAAEGVFILASSIAGKQQLVKLGIIVIAAILIGMTSVPAKAEQQTAQWPPGVQWTFVTTEQGMQSPDLQGYVQMAQTLPKNTRLYAFCAGDHRAIGFDMQSEPWDLDTALFRQKSMNLTGDQIVAFLHAHRYEYVTVDATCVREAGENATQELVAKLSATGLFQPVIAQPGFLLAKVS